MERQLWILLLCLVFIVGVCEGSWGQPGSGQYHIQTDEGPERYFRFQTDNGQFRKEKRLQDGTVIGTDAWIDAAGYLRQKDYIADKNGYRILKSKVVFVGQGRPIEDAIKSVKSIPAQSGILVDGSGGGQSRANGILPTTTSKPDFTYSTTTTITKGVSPRSGYLSPAEAAKIPPSSYLGYDHYPPETVQRQPDVFIRPHSHPVDYAANALPKSYYLPSSTTERSVSIPSQSFEPPYKNFKRIRPIGVASSTPSPIAADDFERSSTEQPDNDFYSSSTPQIVYSRDYPTYTTPSSHQHRISPSTTSSPNNYDNYDDDDQANIYGSSTERPLIESSTRPQAVLPLDVNNLEALLPPHLPRNYRKSRPRPTRPEYGENTATPFVQSNNLGSGYDPQFEEYDGVAVTKNGFRYYLPKQYQEEENVGPQKRAGSFGYVDPFGIRRVIYYNASPERGFVHRKNNRYVGSNGTPYDPRPL